jgi:hypothetical protein
MQRMEKSVARASMSFGKLTGAMTVANLAARGIERAFEGIGEAIRGSTEAAWGYDKAMRRIQSSFMANQRIGLGGKPAPGWEKIREFGVIKGQMGAQSKATGTRPNVTAALVNSMAQSGMTPKDISELLPGLMDTLVAKDVQDPETAAELGKSLGNAVMKDRPLHLTRQNIGTALGIDEKEMKKLFFTGTGEDATAIPVQDRGAQVARLLGIQYKDMAKNIMASEEGTKRMSEYWHDIAQLRVGETFKRMELTWDRIVNDLFPRFQPMLEGLLTTVEKWIDKLNTGWDKFWAKSQEGIDHWIHGFIPVLERAENSIARLSVDILKAFGGMFGGVAAFDSKSGHPDHMGWDPRTHKMTPVKRGELTSTGWLETQASQTTGWISDTLDKFSKFLESDNPWGKLWDKIVESFQPIITPLQKAADSLEQIANSPLFRVVSGDGGGPRSVLSDLAVQHPRAAAAASVLTGGMSNMVLNSDNHQTYIPGTGWVKDPGKNGQGWLTYGEYGTEPRSSNWNGKHDLRAESSYGIGLGKNVANAYGVTEGQWVYVDGMGWRKFNENASRDNSIELWYPDAAHDATAGKRLNISKVRHSTDRPTDDNSGDGAKPGRVPGHTSITIHQHGLSTRDAADQLVTASRQALRKTYKV